MAPTPTRITTYRTRFGRWRRFLRRRSTGAASAVLVLLILGALFAPIITPQNPYDLRTLNLGDSLRPPVWQEGGHMPYLFGTDIQGRDILSTILYGSRTSFLVGFAVVVLAGLVGGLIGLIGGYYGGWFDTLTMRMADSLLSFSTTLIAMLFLGIFRTNSLWLVIAAIVVADWVQYARTMRGAVLAIKSEDFVTATKAMGGSDAHILFKHILPNSIQPLLVVAAANFGLAVMLEATLSFLGVGVPITQPSLGMLISQGKDFIYAGMWWLILPPAAVLMAIVFSLNLIADWLRDDLDPKSVKP